MLTIILSFCFTIALLWLNSQRTKWKAQAESFKLRYDYAENERKKLAERLKKMEASWIADQTIEFVPNMDDENDTQRFVRDVFAPAYNKKTDTVLV